MYVLFSGGQQLLSSIDPLAADGSGFKSSLVGGTQSAVVGGSSNALTSKLDKMSDSVTGQTVVDPKVGDDDDDEEEEDDDGDEEEDGDDE